MGHTTAAYRLTSWLGEPELVGVPVPVPRAGQVLVRVAGNGLCHSDLTMRQIPAEIGEVLGWRMPFTLGHECAGWIEEVTAPGPEWSAPGQPVALISPTSCGTCQTCRRGLDSACPHGLAGRGYGRDGGLAGFVLVDDVRSLVPLPAGLDPVTAGPLTDAGATSYHAVRRIVGRLKAGTTAVVLGAGGLGAFAVQHLRALAPEAQVVAVDVAPARLALAAELGAHVTVDDVQAVGGAEVVLDFVGTDATVAAGLGAVRPGGAYGLVGAAGGTFRRPWYGGLPREAEVFTFQGSTVADAWAVVELAAAGRIRSLVETFPLAKVAEAYAALESGDLRGRAVVVPEN